MILLDPVGFCYILFDYVRSCLILWSKRSMWSFIFQCDPSKDRNNCLIFKTWIPLYTIIKAISWTTGVVRNWKKTSIVHCSVHDHHYNLRDSHSIPGTSCFPFWTSPTAPFWRFFFFPCRYFTVKLRILKILRYPFDPF